MKICFLAAAMSIHTQRWVKYFADRGHETHLISDQLLGSGDIGDAKLHVLAGLPSKLRVVSFLFNLLSYNIQIKRLIRDIKPDILHAHYISEYGFWAALSGFHPLVLSAWGSDVLVDPTRSRINDYFVRYALKRADVITCSGENTKQQAIQLGAPPGSAYLIHHGVDTRKFSPSGRIGKEDVASDIKVVVSIRNLNSIYDLETLIRSVPLVLAQMPDVKFVIVGEGAQKDYLEDLAVSLNVLDSVRFVGHISHEDIPGYLNAADVYVSTSLSDSGPSISLLEAMACGLAPVVTDVGDVGKWITDGENGFVIPIKRPDLLAEKIICLLDSEKLRERMGIVNRQLAEEKYDYEKEMGKMERIYGQLLRDKHPQKQLESS